MLVLALNAGASAAPRVSVRDSASFVVVDVPASALDLSLSATRLSPPRNASAASSGASTGAYVHPGAEYGIVLSGFVARWDAGQTRAVDPGSAFAAAAGLTSASSAAQDAVIIDAFLTPHGDLAVRPGTGPARSPLVTRIFERRFAVDSVPATPFTLVEQLIDLPPGAATIRFSYGARAFFCVANGAVTLERGRALSHYLLGEPFDVAAGEVVRLSNPERRLASVMLVLLLPEAVRLTQPYRAY
ncbi:MAG TPA: hypothetical protein VGD50_02750 [Candidatus Baltobacteraceae bacterium]